MSRVILVSRAATGLLFLAQLGLGIVMWTGHGQSLMQAHMALGALFVIGVWTIAAVCAHAGASPVAALGVAIAGAVVLLFGLSQAQLLPGSQHWVVRVVHLLLAFAAMAVASRLTTMVPGMARRPGLGEPRQEPAGSVHHGA